jgi:amino acid transporter
VIVSLLIAGLVALFAALCYAEFAALIPAAGSAYTYTYVVLGELPAWLVGECRYIPVMIMDIYQLLHVWCNSNLLREFD